MTTRAVSTFVIDRQEPTEAHWGGGQLVRMRYAKTFTGDVAGTSTVEATLLRADEGPAVYIAIERIDGAVHGRAGSFVVLHEGVRAADGASQAHWTVVAGSGTGELVGLQGSAEITETHEFIVEYDIVR